MAKFLRKTVTNIKEFLIGDNYTTIAKKHPKAFEGTLGHATKVGDRYVVLAGALINDQANKPLGLNFRDTDVTDGDMPLAVVVKGTVRQARLPVQLDDGKKAALKGIIFV